MAVSRKNSSTIYSGLLFFIFKKNKFQFKKRKKKIPEHPTSKNSSHYYQKKKEKKAPRNAVIINFSQGEKVTVEDVKRELAKLVSGFYLLLLSSAHFQIRISSFRSIVHNGFMSGICHISKVTRILSSKNCVKTFEINQWNPFRQTVHLDNL